MNFQRIQQNPFETTEDTTKPAVKQAVKAAGDVARGMASDAKQQLTGDFGMQAMEQGQNRQKILSQQQQQTIQQQSQQVLVQTRQNLEKINSEIKIVRQKKTQEKQQTTQTETQKKEQKEKLEEKKKSEPIWKKLLQGKTGSKEGNVRASG